jgi:hypothetical protein
MKNIFNSHHSQSNSAIATAFAVVVTGLLIGGYEETQTATHPEVAIVSSEPAPAVARMETIVVTAKRG